MAENEQSQQEKTEPPSPKRLEDARKKGQIARSRELPMMFVMISGAITLLLLRQPLGQQLEAIMAAGLTVDPNAAQIPAATLATAIQSGVVMLIPLWLVVVVAAVLGNLLPSGFIFSAEAVRPQLSKLSPVAGLKRLFGPNGLAELVKAMVKFALVAVVAVVLLALLADDLLGLARRPVANALGETAAILGFAFLVLSAALIVIAAADVPFQVWQHRRKLRMTKQELKDEHKETEGRPEVKSRIRGLQQELANRRMMEAVPDADFVAMNPTHFAVALKYDSSTMKAPRVVAKGQDLLALRIKQIAQENGVPLFQHPLLARALYRTTALGDEIPPRLYLAVAQVLSYVMGLRTGQPAPPEIEIDSDLLDLPMVRPRRGAVPRPQRRI